MVVFLVNGDHIVGGCDGKKKTISAGARRERNAGGIGATIVVPRYGKWIVSGTKYGRVTVWGVESKVKVNEFKEHYRRWAWAVDALDRMRWGDHDLWPWSYVCERERGEVCRPRLCVRQAPSPGSIDQGRAPGGYGTQMDG